MKDLSKVEDITRQLLTEIGEDPERKGLVRTLLVSQLDTEIESTIRKKCLC